MMARTKELDFDEGGCQLRKEKNSLPAEPLMMFSSLFEPSLLGFRSSLSFDTFVLSFYLLYPLHPFLPGACLEMFLFLYSSITWQSL